MVNKKTIYEKLILVTAILLLGMFVSKAFAQNVPQGYQSMQVLQPGILVRLDPKNGKIVEPVDQVDQSNTLGVVISPSSAAVSLSNNSALPQTFVANNGQFNVLVTTQDGPIQIGNYITVSAINGIGMAANSTQQTVIGKAVQSFTGKSGVISTATLKDSTGKSETVQLGSVEVDMIVEHNPLFTQKNSNGVPSILSSAAKVITDRPVGALRIYASLGVLTITIMIAGAVLYIGIRSSITAIGRNPLAKKTISRSLVSVILASLIVFIIGVVAVYLLLKL